VAAATNGDAPSLIPGAHPGDNLADRIRALQARAARAAVPN
jgi:hypothetical protein